MMYGKRGMIAGIAVLFLCLTGTAYGDDLEDVKTAFNADMKRFNAKDISAFSTEAHADVVLFGMLSPLCRQGEGRHNGNAGRLLCDSERVTFTPINPEFRVIGASALAWGHFTNTEVPSVGPREVIHGRYTFTYAKRDGKWVLVGLHFSPLGVEE